MKITDKNQKQKLFEEFSDYFEKNDIDENTILFSESLNKHVRPVVVGNRVSWYEVSEDEKNKTTLDDLFEGEKNKSEDDDTDNEEYDDVKKANEKKNCKESQEYSYKIETKDIQISNEDFKNIFVNTDISEETVEKLKNIFVTILTEKVNEKIESIENDISEAYENSKDKIEENVDKYLKYVIEEWVKENTVAIDEGLKNEIMEDFIFGLKELFTEHYVDVPQEKRNLIEDLSEKLVESEQKMDELLNQNIKLIEENEKYLKEKIINECAKDLSEYKKDRLIKLSENISFDGKENFIKKVEDIKESLKETRYNKTEINEEIRNENIINTNPEMDLYIKYITKK